MPDISSSSEPLIYTAERSFCQCTSTSLWTLMACIGNSSADPFEFAFTGLAAAVVRCALSSVLSCMCWYRFEWVLLLGCEPLSQCDCLGDRSVLISEPYQPFRLSPRNPDFGSNGRYVGRFAQIIARPSSIVDQSKPPDRETKYVSDTRISSKAPYFSDRRQDGKDRQFAECC